MSRKKLTLSIDRRLTERAKEIADERGTSVSRLVETFFTALQEEATEKGSDSPLQAQTPGDADEGPERSAWAKRWRGAFARKGATYPDDPAWDDEVLVEEIEKKHAPE